MTFRDFMRAAIAVLTAISAFLAYALTLAILYMAGSELTVIAGWRAWIVPAAAAAPLIWLLVRLYTRRAAPWPDLSLPFFGGWIFFAFSILIMWPGVFHDLPLKSAAGNLRSKLKVSREKLSAIASYGGSLPSDPASALAEMPVLKLPLSPHAPTTEVRVSTFADIRDSGLWLYVADPSSPTVIADCTHPDHNGRPWSAY